MTEVYELYTLSHYLLKMISDFVHLVKFFSYLCSTLFSINISDVCSGAVSIHFHAVRKSSATLYHHQLQKADLTLNHASQNCLILKSNALSPIKIEHTTMTCF